MVVSNSKIKLLVPATCHLNANYQKAFYAKRRDSYKKRKTTSVNIKEVLQNSRLHGASNTTIDGTSAKEPSSNWHHSAQRLRALKTEEKRVAVVAVIVMLVGAIAIKYTVSRESSKVREVNEGAATNDS